MVHKSESPRFYVAEYDPRKLVCHTMLFLLNEGVRQELGSAERAYEAAGRFLEALGVEPTWPRWPEWPDLPPNVVPFQPRAVRDAL